MDTEPVNEMQINNMYCREFALAISVKIHTIKTNGRNRDILIRYILDRYFQFFPQQKTYMTHGLICTEKEDTK